MKKLLPREVYIPNYLFVVHKIVGFSYITLMFKVHNRSRHGVGPFHHCTPRWDLYNGFLSDINGDCL